MSEPSSYGVLAALAVFLVASIAVAAIAQRRIEKGRFLAGYFLGNRGLGAWAMALTATVQSGGTFMGFPALVYSHGWIVALWIAGYMIVPLSGFAILGKRLAQLSRRSGALTVPDLFHERFASPAAGLFSSLIIILFMGAMMIAQFKAGAIVMKIAWPDPRLSAAVGAGEVDWGYFIGLIVFSLTVVGYTLMGGFLASVWNDLFQSVLMVIGVLILLYLVVPMAGGLEQATRTAMEKTSPAFASGPGYTRPDEPGGPPSVRQFLTPGLAVSFFFVWVFAGVGSPAGMVRVMASQGTEVLRKSIFLLSIYNCMIYVPLIAICIAGRALIPSLDKPDEIIPQLAVMVTRGTPGGSLVAGLILAAPFGAVMATVSCYLLVIASGLVKDIYLRFLRSGASTREIRWVTYAAMIAVGLIAVGANIKPVRYLQALVVFSGTGAAAAFVTPILMTCFWRRATAAGLVSSMLAGAGTVLSLFGLNWIARFAQSLTAESFLYSTLEPVGRLVGPDPKIGIADPLQPYYLLGLDPIMWGLAASAATGIVVSLLTRPPDPDVISRFFDAKQPAPDR